MENSDVSDRRRFPRIREDAGMTWKKISENEFFRNDYEGVTKNISGGGVCFVTHSELHAGDMVALNLTLAEFGARILALGRVVRLENAEDGFEAAVEFWWIGWDDDTAQKAIGDYIRGKLE